MDGAGSQVDGHAPLLEAAVLVSENCPACRGTGYRVLARLGESAPWAGSDSAKLDMPTRTTSCERCEGAGREVREVPMSELAGMLRHSLHGPVAPSPSELRG